MTRRVLQGAVVLDIPFFNLFDGNQRDKESFTRCCSVRHTVL